MMGLKRVKGYDGIGYGMIEPDGLIWDDTTNGKMQKTRQGWEDYAKARAVRRNRVYHQGRGVWEGRVFWDSKHEAYLIEVVEVGR